MISLIMILRSYLGLSQLQLAHQLDISVRTLQRLEQGGAHGTLETYLRLSNLRGIPVDALLANDFTLIPADFFQRHPVPKEKTIATDEPSIIGFRGEQLILAQERARVGQEHPTLLPLVRRTADYPRLSGYDILSFDVTESPWRWRSNPAYRGGAALKCQQTSAKRPSEWLPNAVNIGSF